MLYAQQAASQIQDLEALEDGRGIKSVHRACDAPAGIFRAASISPADPTRLRLDFLPGISREASTPRNTPLEEKFRVRALDTKFEWLTDAFICMFRVIRNQR